VLKVAETGGRQNKLEMEELPNLVGHCQGYTTEGEDEARGYPWPRLASVVPFPGCIGSQLKNDLLGDEQKSIQEEFLANNVVLVDVADVLNMRFADLRNWSWEADDGMFYEPRRLLNGKFRIMMGDDILQAIFLHFVGIPWSVQLNHSFKSLMVWKSLWKCPIQMSNEELYGQ
jgi:hypothetical protein